ncbi:CHAT domain-containing protein [Isosphaeraceae bacterium EP7]
MSRSPGPAWLAAMLALLTATGCPFDDPARPARPRKSAATAELGTVSLRRPDGQATPAVEFAWAEGMGLRAGTLRLVVRFLDGRFAVYMPDRSDRPTFVSPAETGARALGVSPGGRVVTGDLAGLVLWDVSGESTQPIARLDCGAVSALACSPDVDGDVIAGLDDGRLLRVTTTPDGRIAGPSGEQKPASLSPGLRPTSIAFDAGGASLLVRRAGGSVERHRRDLSGQGVNLGAAIAVATAGGKSPSAGLARLAEGPVVSIERVVGGPALRLSVADAAGTIAFVGTAGERSVMVPIVGGVLLIPAEVSPSSLASRARFLAASEPLDRWTAASTSPDGGRIGLARASGRIELIPTASALRRAVSWSLEDAADLAFQPDRRLYRRRGSSAELDLPTALAARYESLVDRVDRGEGDDLSGPLLHLEADPGMTPLAAAEVLTLRATIERRQGRPTATVVESVRRASAAFGRRERLDRQAEMEFWLAVELAPGLDGGDGIDAAEARDHARLAAELASRSSPPMPRLRVLSEALGGWIASVEGEGGPAGPVVATLGPSIRSDPVLRMVPELDRIVAALAAGREDWPTAEAADARVLARVDRAGRPGLWREAALGRLTALAALGRWRDGVDLAGVSLADEPAWDLRRATFLARAGHLADAGPWHAAVAPHIRARRLAAEEVGKATDPSQVPELSRVLNELDGIAAAHRSAGRPWLAAEADLERAEILERAGQPDAAADLLSDLRRRLADRALKGTGGEASRPILGADGRIARGTARCKLATGRPEEALAALDRADRRRWGDRVGRSLASASMAFLPESGRPQAERRLVAWLGGETEAEEPPAGIEADGARLDLEGPAKGVDVEGLKLRTGEAVLVYAAAGPESLVGFLIRPGLGVEARRVPVTRTLLRRAVEAWRSELGDSGRGLRVSEPGRADALIGLLPEPDRPSTPSGMPPPPQAQDWGTFLDDVLIRPFGPAFNGVERLLIVPGDATSAVAFEVIGRDRPLGERFGLRYAPSLTLIRRQRAEHPPRGTGLLIVASPEDTPRGLSRRGWADPFIHAELAEVIRALTRPVVLHAGPDAGPRRLLSSEVAHARSIQVSALAVLDPSRTPSGEPELLLRPGDPPPCRVDGRVSAGDLLRVPLSAEVLAMAVGDPDDRGAVTPAALRDLARAGLSAGASTVLLSLWDPPTESSAILLSEFHRGVARGDSPARALEAARRLVARNPEFQDPVHWACFVLYDAAP